MDTEQYPLGIRYWMQVDTSKKPHYTVFECMGRLLYTDQYWFKERKGSPLLFIKSLSQLNEDGFRPFYMNVEKMRKNYGELG